LHSGTLALVADKSLLGALIAACARRMPASLVNLSLRSLHRASSSRLALMSAGFTPYRPH